VTEREEEIQRARYTALTEKIGRASTWGADAVVGVVVDAESPGSISW
jgi:uncharacterized protein YbjQ (UPF0145 family)